MALNTTPEFSPAPSLALRAFGARNSPLDHLVRLRRTASHPLNCTRIRPRRGAGLSMMRPSPQIGIKVGNFGILAVSVTARKTPAASLPAISNAGFAAGNPSWAEE